MAVWGRWIRGALLAAAAGMATLAIADRATAAEPSPSPSPLLPILPAIPLLPEIVIPLPDLLPGLPLPEVVVPEVTLPEISLPAAEPALPSSSPPPAAPVEPVAPVDTAVPPPAAETPAPNAAPRTGPRWVTPALPGTVPGPNQRCHRQAHPVLLLSTPAADAAPTGPPPSRPGDRLDARLSTAVAGGARCGGEGGGVAGVLPAGPTVAGCGTWRVVTSADEMPAGRIPGRGPPPPR